MQPSQPALWEAQSRNVELLDGDIRHRLNLRYQVFLQQALMYLAPTYLAPTILAPTNLEPNRLMVEGFHQTKLRRQNSLQILPLPSRPYRHNNPKQRCVFGPTMNFHLRMLQREVLTLHQVQQCGDEVS
jgi:hypothetical protein